MLERARDAGYAVVEPLVEFTARLGVTPNAVTSLSLFVALVAGGLLYTATHIAYAAAATLVVVNGLLDVLDGELARRTDNATERGDLLDHAVDRYADVAVVAGAAAGVGAWTLGFFAVSGVVLDADAGTKAQAVTGGRMYGGLLTRADISALVVIGALGSAVDATALGYEAFVFVLAVFAVGGHLTAVQRAVVVARLYGNR
ncbi:MAG: CDP-alcohol phosphatidyltransferase family protein [Halobacteriales archaeon]|nr:CDP-alcohol phosphatidyltransferase family protein [Halobacteriales archaeon]